MNKTFVVVGMAGAGKTTFCQRLYSWILQENLKKGSIEEEISRMTIRTENDNKNKDNKNNDSKNEDNKNYDNDNNKNYDNSKNNDSKNDQKHANYNIKATDLISSVNLDPAVFNTKMPCSIDIRDYVDYSEIRKKYNLGPNGGTNTCLNLFLLENIDLQNKKYTIIDTPGQIEAFTWSSPGDVLMERLKKDANNLFIVYVIDISDSDNLYLFMSNMIFAAAIKAKWDCKVICIFNKSDINDFDCKKFMDYEYFRKLTNSEKNCEVGNLSTYFEEFYNALDCVNLSSLTGAGKDEFFKLTGMKQKI